MKWQIEEKSSKPRCKVEGSFDDAIAVAQAKCKHEWQRWLVRQLPSNILMAEVGSRGAVSVRNALLGHEVQTLMRRHHKTIAELSFAMGVTQDRIRHVRDRGLFDHHAVRDWLEFITGADVGPLPERYRISGRQEEGDCGYCGCPLFNGEYAFEYGLGIFCSVSCSRLSRGWGKKRREVAA